MTHSPDAHRPLFAVSSAGGTPSAVRYASEGVVPFLTARGYRAAHFTLPINGLLTGELDEYEAAFRTDMEEFSQLIPAAVGLLIVNAAVSPGGQLIHREALTSNPEISRAHTGNRMAQIATARALGIPVYALDAGHIFGGPPVESIEHAQFRALGVIDLAGDLSGIPEARSSFDVPATPELPTQ